MLIKFTSGGRGGGGTIASYLTDPERHGRDHAPPEVVRGDIDRTRELIDSIERKWTYTHGVLSFALEDAPTGDQQQEAMDRFERLAFAGLDPEQYDITWVRHQHTEGARVELHFVTPRMELTTGKSLNIAPPGWERSFAPLRDALNYEHGWARPDDPARARELHRAPERALEGFSLREGREGIHGYLMALVEAQKVTDRSELVQALKEAGLEVPRQGKDYVTARDPETGDRYRLRGRIYEKDWRYDAELDRAVTREAKPTDGRDRGIDRERAEAARIEVAAREQSRAEYHAGAYSRDERGPGAELAAVEALREMVVGRADPDLAADRGVVSLALSDPEDSRNRAVSDFHPRGADLSAVAGRDAGADLHRQNERDRSDLHASARGGLDHGPDDSLRAGVAQTIRNIGRRVRNLTDTVRGYGAGLVGAVRESWRESAADRAAAERFEQTIRGSDRSLEYADRAHERLGDCREQVTGRAREIERAHARHVERDRGLDYGL